MIDPNSYPSGASRPALKPESIGYPKANAAVLTVADVDPDVEIPDEEQPDGVRKVLTVVFKEFPDLTYYTNKTGRTTLIEKFGTDERRWLGQRVPLVVVDTMNPRTKKAQASLWIADKAEWDRHLGVRRVRKSARGRRGK